MRKLFFLIGSSLIFFCFIGQAQTLPAGFTKSVIGTDWNLPLGTAFTPDGQKLFVWEKDGRVYVCNRDASGSYVKQSTPVLDIAEEVANWGDHGLMGFALDPNYSANGLIYLLYVVDRHYLLNFGTPAYNPATSTRGATIGRITRYKTVTNGNNLVTDLASRQILLGETKSTGIALTHDSHGLGTLAFAADGTLLATAGDGASYYAVDKGNDTDTDFDLALIDGIIRPEENVGAFRAQLLNCHNGKLLRIDPVTGNGVSSNPYYSADQPRSPKSRVWAFGLRNPFRFSIKPGTGSTNPAAGDVGEIYIGDVGWNTYEEVNVITTPGVNCGWPLFEGLTPTPGYSQALTANRDEPNPLYGINGCAKQFFDFQDLLKQSTADNNKTVYNPCNQLVSIGNGNRYFHHRPIIDWQHFTDTARVGTFAGNNAATALVGTPESNVIGTPFPGNCAVGGPWYSGNSFPAEYNNRYFVADHDGNWIKCIGVDFTDVVTEVKSFGSGFSGIVNVNMNPLDGTLVVVELGDFSTIPTTIKQIKYGGNQSPVVKITSNKTYGPSALAVNFTGSNSSDPDGTVAAYAWSFGDGGTSVLVNPSHSFTAPANTPSKFVVKLTVTDNMGASSTDSLIISVNNTPPVVNITSPVKNSLYKIGADTVYTCRATVTDAEPGALKYEWQTFLRHNSHAHPQPVSNDTVTTTNIERIGCNGDTYYWLIKLTVTDAAGLSTTDSSKIFPDCNRGPDITPPTIASVLPLNGATGVNAGTTVTAIFSEVMDTATINSTTFQLTNSGNVNVPAGIKILSNQVTLIPTSPLTGSTVYTATIKGGSAGVKDAAGNALQSDYHWNFTTAAVDITPPVITGVTPLNGATGVTTGTSVIANFSEAINPSTINGASFQLRNSADILITAVVSVSTNQVTLTPSSILAGSTLYTVTLKSGASGVKDLAGNALANDYTWSFTTGAADNTAPVVSSVSPLNGATAVSVNTTITANISEAINTATATATTFQLKDAASNIIPATISFANNQLILTASAPLANSAAYTVTIKGGASGVKDLAGNSLVNDYTWTFTTVANSGATSFTVFLPSAQPQEAMNNDGQAIEVGMKFRASQNGFITGVRYYKGLNSTGTRTGHLWSSNGSLIGNATFTAETASGWQQVLFPAPVAITANTTYVVSYFSSAGYYASTGNYFTQAVVAGPLRALANGEDGPNGVYQYSTVPVFPSNNGNASNYWVDAIFTTSGGSAAPVVTTHPGAQTKCAGNNASFSAAASGNPAPTVQWQSSTDGTNWSNITGATNTVLTFATTITDNNKQYRAVFTNSNGSSNTNPAVLTVNSMPQLSGNLAITTTSNSNFSYTAASNIAGTVFTWSRAVVAGISNTAANGSGNISETLINTTSSAVNVTYVYTLMANGCSRTQNVIVTVNPATAATVSCTIDSTSLLSHFNGTAIPAGRYIWFNSSFKPGSLGPGTDAVTITLTHGVISFTANNVPYTLNVPNARIRFDATVTTASTQFINNVWETVVPRSYNSDVFMSGLSYLVPVNFPGNYMNVKWTTDINIDKAGMSLGWRWGAAVYTSLGGHAGINVKPVNGTTQNAYANADRAGSPENFKSFVVDGALGTGGTNYTGSFSAVNTATCTINPIPAAPVVTVSDNCGSSVLTAGSVTGSLLWSNGATSNSITVTAGGTYSVTQTVNGYTSAATTGIAAPHSIPQLSGSLAVNATSNSNFSYTAASNIAGIVFTWSRAVVAGISNTAANGSRNISETLINTTSSAVNVTYVYTLMANGCSRTQNVIVTVNPATAATVSCTIDSTSLLSHFNGTAIPAGRYIWFNSSFKPGSLGPGTDAVTITLTHGVISFTANNVPYTLNVPNARIRFDATVTTASTQFINNVWETVVPRSYNSDVFMSGLSYLVPVNFPGNYMNVKWTTDINIDKAGMSLGWRWGAAVYTSLGGHAGINVKPVNGTTQNAYANADRAGSAENFKSFVVDGALGTGGTNYTGSFSATNTATCTVNTPQQRSSVQKAGDQLLRGKQLFILPGQSLDVNVLPNPSSSYFKLIVKSNNGNPVHVSVTNIFGQVLEKYESIAPGTTLQLGQRLPGGTYLVEVTQGDQRKAIKIIKVN